MRSVELEPTLERRCLAAQVAWRLSDVPTVREEASAVLAEAQAKGARDLEGRALVLLAEIALHADSDVASARRLADDALGVLAADDLYGLYEARSVLATVGWWLGDAQTSVSNGEATVALARAMNRRDLESIALSQLAGAFGEASEEGAALVEQAAALAAESGSREAIGWASVVAGRLAARAGRYELAETTHA